MAWKTILPGMLPVSIRSALGAVMPGKTLRITTAGVLDTQAGSFYYGQVTADKEIWPIGESSVTGFSQFWEAESIEELPEDPQNTQWALIGNKLYMFDQFATPVWTEQGELALEAGMIFWFLSGDDPAIQKVWNGSKWEVFSSPIKVASPLVYEGGIISIDIPALIEILEENGMGIGGGGEEWEYATAGNHTLVVPANGLYQLTIVGGGGGGGHRTNSGGKGGGGGGSGGRLLINDAFNKNQSVPIYVGGGGGIRNNDGGLGGGSSYVRNAVTSIYYYGGGGGGGAKGDEGTAAGGTGGGAGTSASVPGSGGAAGYSAGAGYGAGAGAGTFSRNGGAATEVGGSYGYGPGPGATSFLSPYGNGGNGTPGWDEGGWSAGRAGIVRIKQLITW